MQRSWRSRQRVLNWNRLEQAIEDWVLVYRFNIGIQTNEFSPTILMYIKGSSKKINSLGSWIKVLAPPTKLLISESLNIWLAIEDWLLVANRSIATVWVQTILWTWYTILSRYIKRMPIELGTGRLSSRLSRLSRSRCNPSKMFKRTSRCNLSHHLQPHPRYLNLRLPTPKSTRACLILDWLLEPPFH